MKENKSNTPKSVKKIPGKKIMPKPPRFNIMWLYAAIVLGLFAVQFFFNNDTVKQISYQKFENEVLKSRDVEKLVAFKNQDLLTVEVYIKKDRLSQPKYKEFQKKNSLGTPNIGPQFYFTEGSDQALQVKLREAEKDLPAEQRFPLRNPGQAPTRTQLPEQRGSNSTER